MSKKYPYVGELEPEKVKALEELEIDVKYADLYVDSSGEIFVYVDNEGHYHPDDPSAVSHYYQPTGVHV